MSQGTVTIDTIHEPIDLTEEWARNATPDDELGGWDLNSLFAIWIGWTFCWENTRGEMPGGEHDEWWHRPGDEAFGLERHYEPPNLFAPIESYEKLLIEGRPYPTTEILKAMPGTAVIGRTAPNPDLWAVASTAADVETWPVVAGSPRLAVVRAAVVLLALGIPPRPPEDRDKSIHPFSADLATARLNKDRREQK